MSSTVTALYDTRAEAERALASAQAELSLAHGAIYDHSQASRDALQRLDLQPDERAACQSKLAEGEYLLVAQVRSGEDPNRVVAILERAAADNPPATMPGAATREPEQGAHRIAEERVPLVEETLRVGTREVVRGGARVQSRMEEAPVTQDVELFEEFARVERRPASRLVDEAELERGGLMRERVIEIAQVREEAVVHKEVFVREEVVVSKTVEHRVEQIHETVRHTEVEVEEIGANPADAR